MTKKEDIAGPVMGWSVGTGIDQKAAQELLNLPCKYSFKVIGEATERFQTEIIAQLESKLGRSLDPQEIEVRPSSAQKYISLTFHLYMETIEDIHAIYAILKAHDLTRFLL